MLISILKTTTQTKPTADVSAQPVDFSTFIKKSFQKRNSINDQNLSDNNSESFSFGDTDSIIVGNKSDQNPVSVNYCDAPDFVTSQIPFWIVQNYGNNTGDNYLISFLKEYYNWLYCGFKKPQYQLTPYDLSQLLDIDLVPEAFLETYAKTYAPFIKWASIPAEDKQNLRNFLKSIKTAFLIKKGTENAYRHILKELFGVTNVNFDYPKKYLTRLNGGKYAGIPWTIDNTSVIDLPTNFDPNNPISNDVIANDTGYNTRTRPNLFGSALNESVLPDDVFWHDYSYLLTSDAALSSTGQITYKDTILSATHPAGTIGFFEQYVNIDDTDIDSDEVTTITNEYLELPEIGRYLLLYPDRTIGANGVGLNLYNEYAGGCGTPLDSYTCYCCNNICYADGVTFEAPQHKYPGDWVNSIKQETKSKSIGYMSIEKFVLGFTGASINSNYERDTCSYCITNC
jgi:hypothetical protein